MFFAEVDETSTVVNVIVSDQQHVNSRPNKEKFVEGAIDGSLRKNYPGKGYTHQTTPDRFISPQPFPSWSVNNGTGKWQAPVGGPPQNGRYYHWDEDAQDWVEHQAATGS